MNWASPFDRMFRGQVFGPRYGFIARRWQDEADEAHRSHVEEFDTSLSIAGGREGTTQHRFVIHAGTGSGKTKAAGLIASRMLNAQRIGKVVYVCPNVAIKDSTWKDLSHYFGIDLIYATSGLYDKCADGIPPGKHGYITTYAGILKRPKWHRAVCAYQPVLLILDEIHHLGDHPELQWAEKAQEAFGDIPYMLGLTGSPYRSDGNLIWGVEYEPVPDNEAVRRFRANYTYPLGRAIQEQVCRMPLFVWHDGTVQLRPPGRRGVITVSFDDTISQKWGQDRLRGAVSYGTATRGQMLAAALRDIRAEGRKVIIFLGGDTQGNYTPIQDATEFLPAELRGMGIADEEFVCITSRADDGCQPGAARETIARLRAGDWGPTWIVIAIDKISEGTDIPDLSAAIFLTTVTTKQSLIQRIGRCLRWHDGKFSTCYIYMFPDPRNVDVANEIQSEIVIDQPVKVVGERRPAEGDGDGGGHPTRTEAVGIDGGNIRSIQIGDRTLSWQQVQAAQEKMRRNRIPAGLAETALVLIQILEDAENGNGTTP